MSKVSGEAINIGLLKRVLSYVKPYRNLFAWSVILTILLAAIAPIRPMLVGYTLDEHIMKGNYPGLLNMSIVMLVAVIVQSAFQYAHTLITNLLGQSTIRDLRIKVFTHISNLRLKFFDKTPLGQLITRTVSDMETIADIFSEGLIAMIGDLLQIIVIIGIMFWMDWQLSLIVLIPMPLLLMATRIFQMAIKNVFQHVRNEVSNLNTFLQEHISGIAIIQYFAREEQEFKKFKHINARYRNANIRSNWYYSIFFPVVDIISGLSLGLLIWYGAKTVLHNPNIEPGIITTFIMFINMLFRPIREFADKFNTLQMGMVGAERVFKLLDTAEQTPNQGTLVKPVLDGNISFKRVWFSYDQDGEAEPNFVLKDLSFDVKAGQTVALVGATGAGKSSTINILNRFYEIQKGKIEIDGIDIRDYELNYLRSQIATVQQEVFLYSDSILNNITLHNPDIKFEDVVAAAQKVGADDFIKSLPDGYHYNVMERGSTLSAGQAQLISFIRAMVHQPRILVLDEATSSVDTETEILIQNAIEKLMQDRTSIVIAHRLSTIQKANLIIVLDKGEIKEKGTHQQLLKLNGYYKKLYDLQFSSSGISKH
jgi:ATP-binding cassette subfamily B protein